MRHIAVSASALAVLALSAGAAFGDGRGIRQSGEQKDMRRVGHTDLQGRPAYHPDFIKYPDGRVIAFVGTHGGTRPNPLKGGAVEANGTMIIDITDPRRPVEKFHIPAPIASGSAQTQSNRMCLGRDLPGGMPGRVYLMRNVQVNTLSVSGYEVWDVTNVASPTPVSAVRNLRNTHKHWWECKTGIAYLPGSKGAPAPQWRVGQMMLIYDFSNPASPQYLRTFGLPGAQPGATGPLTPTLHGPISAFQHPNAAGRLARGAGPDDVIGNRLYLAWGVGDNGVLQILDRKKLLPPPHGTWMQTADNADSPSAADLVEPQTARLDMSNDQGGHTSFPVFGLRPKSYHQGPPTQGFTEFLTRDIVLLASESTADQ